MVLRPKRRRLLGYILQFICTMNQEYPTMEGPRVGKAATRMNRLKLLSFILALWMIPSFPRKSKLNLFLPRKAFFLTMLVSLSPKIFQPFLPSLFLFLYLALSGLAFMRAPLAQAHGAHSILLKWHRWNLASLQIRVQQMDFPKALYHAFDNILWWSVRAKLCLGLSLLFSIADGRFMPFSSVRFSLGGFDLNGPWSWAELWFMDRTKTI